MERLIEMPLLRSGISETDLATGVLLAQRDGIAPLSRLGSPGSQGARANIPSVRVTGLAVPRGEDLNPCTGIDRATARGFTDIGIVADIPDPKRPSDHCRERAPRAVVGGALQTL
jgi:hypothetical protein